MPYGLNGGIVEAIKEKKLPIMHVKIKQDKCYVPKTGLKYLLRNKEYYSKDVHRRLTM